MSLSPFEPLDYSKFDTKIGEFFKLMKEKDKDCPQQDCDKILSPCCNLEVSVIFATLPVEVKCVCGKSFFLKNLVRA